MTDGLSSARLHADGNFAAASAQNIETLGSLRPDDPLTPSAIAKLAFSREREGMHTLALEAADMAMSWAWEDSLAYKEQRSVLEPSLFVNAFKVFTRAAARARLAIAAGDNSEKLRNEASTFRVKAAGARGSALQGIREQRQLPRAHQWGVNILATSAVDRAVGAERPRRGRELTFAMGQAVGSVALGALSESPLFVHHTTSDRGFLGRWLLDKPKAMLRGGVAVTGVALSAPDRPWLNQARDRLILRFF